MFQSERERPGSKWREVDFHSKIRLTDRRSQVREMLVETVSDDLCDFLSEFGSGPVTWDSSSAPADEEPDRRTFVPVPHEADVSAVDWVSTAALSLAHNGFCTLRCSGGSLVPLDVCEGCRVASDERLDKLLACARARGLNPRGAARSKRLHSVP